MHDLLDEDKERVFTDGSGFLLHTNVDKETGKLHCWRLAPGDYVGKKDESELVEVGRFNICY